ncbi:MAG: phage terminase large subunit, partial [Thermodesulfobacteriota bacterium]|nr:phage terminase large subunit [Thermodesulfobacteriota bacterium]
LYRWLKNAVLKLGPPDGSAQTIMIGTVMHSDAVLVRVSRRPDFHFTRFRAVIKFPARMDLWEEWERIFRRDRDGASAFYKDRKCEMDKGSQVLWPGVQPLYELMCERAVDREAFSMEMQNEPLDPESQKFKPENFTFFTDPPRMVLCVGALDPALGKTTGDYTGIVVLGKGEDNKAYVLEADIARYTPAKAVERILHYQKKHGCVRWGVENVAFQAIIMDLLVQASLEKSIPVPALGIKPRFAKEVRIEALAPHVANGVILFNSRHSLLLDQLFEWPKSAHDDGPDALEMAFGLIHAATPIEFKTPKQGRLKPGSKSGEKRGF